MTQNRAELTSAVLWTDVVVKVFERVTQEIRTRLVVYGACSVVLCEVVVRRRRSAPPPHTTPASHLRVSEKKKAYDIR
jgi:hypothetical protein